MRWIDRLRMLIRGAWTQRILCRIVGHKWVNCALLDGRDWYVESTCYYCGATEVEFTGTEEEE